MTTTKYPIGGFAPGNYTCRCVSCKENFMGDKRAVQCEPCAKKEIQPEDIFNEEKMDDVKQVIKECEFKQREIELYKLGFNKNNDQGCYILFKFNCHFYVAFWKITDYDNHKWNILIEDIKYDIETVKKQWYDDLKQHHAYNLAEKENKKRLKDKYNALNSKLQEVLREKVSRQYKSENAIKLEAQVNLLKQLLDEL